MAAISRQSLGYASMRAAIVLIPSYTAAWLTDKMVYVVPTLAAASFFAASITPHSQDLVRNTDEGDGSDDAEADADVDVDLDLEAEVGVLDG